MSMAAAIRNAFNLGGVTFNQSTAPSGDAVITHNVSVDPGYAGTLTTRANVASGAITLTDSSHPYEVNDRVDIYWSTGVQYSIVTNVVGNVISFEGGTGDGLPTQGTAVVMSPHTELDVAVLGTNVKAILLYTAKRGMFRFATTGPVYQWSKELGEAMSHAWEDGNGTDNPITGDAILYVYVSHSDTSAATMRVGVLYDN